MVAPQAAIHAQLPRSDFPNTGNHRYSHRYTHRVYGAPDPICLVWEATLSIWIYLIMQETLVFLVLMTILQKDLTIVAAVDGS